MTDVFTTKDGSNTAVLAKTADGMLVVLSSMAAENYRYLPDWAPVWAAWCFGIVAACLGASALWAGLRSGD